MKKIKNEVFFEEYEIFKNFLGLKNKNIFRVLDLGCGNGRFNLLIDKIFEEKKINQKKIFYGVEKNFDENIKNFSDIFINTDIENFLKNKEKFIGIKDFNFIILSGIFENFLEFDEKFLNKICKILEKNGVVFINFWNYGEEENLFREKKISKVEKYFEENFLPEIKKSEFGEDFSVFYNEKQKNGGWNISLVLRK